MSPLLPYTNCCNVNLKDMLDNGFKMDEAYIETPKSIGVATSIAAQVIEAVSLSQLGGTSVPDIDMTLAPYAQKNYDKHLKDARDFDIKDKVKYAEELTKRDIYQAMQGLEFSINSIHSNGFQTPFVTVSLARGVGKWEKEIQKAMLNVRIKGLGNGVSAVFPKLVVTIEDGINLKPSDPNYDVKQLALYCSARRDYPDIVFGKGIKEITGGSYMTSMGCVDGDETIDYMVEGTNCKTHTTLAHFYEDMKAEFGEKLQDNDRDHYIDLEGILIKDSHKGRAQYVKCKRVIKNDNQSWIDVTFKDGQLIHATSNHPFVVKGKGRVQASDLKVGDVMYKQDGNGTTTVKDTTISLVTKEKEYSYDVTTTSDYFDFSGIVSHNCRSFLPAWKNPKTGEYQIAGRLNLGVVSLDTVMVAMDSKDKDEFWVNLAKGAEIVHKALQEKISYISQETPEMAPILFEQGAIDRLKPDDDLVEKVFKHGRSTVSFGYIGLYETATRFYGPNWEHNQEAVQFTKDIVQYLHDKCAQWYKEEDYYYSLYSTPQQGASY